MYPPYLNLGNCVNHKNLKHLYIYYDYDDKYCCANLHVDMTKCALIHQVLYMFA